MDDRGWYRVIYLQRIENRLHDLHSFIKKSAKTSTHDLNIASERLRGFTGTTEEGERKCPKQQKPNLTSRPWIRSLKIGFSPEQAAVLRLKTTLHIEIIKVVKKRRLTQKEITKVLDIQQPHVSKLLKGDLERTTADRLTKYLRLLGRQVRVSTKAVKMQGADMA